MRNRPDQKEATKIIKDFFSKPNPISPKQLQKSMKREDDHRRIFHRRPRTVENTHFFNRDPFEETKTIQTKIPSQKVREIIYELISDQAVVSPKQYHWTSEDNLKNILKSGAIYSNRVLNKSGVIFEKNGLHKVDADNGDDQVICITPFAVDLGLFFQPGETKLPHRQNRVRLTMDLSKLDTDFQRGKFNQFMKLYDFCSHTYGYECKINEDITFSVARLSGTQCLSMSFMFKGIRYRPGLTERFDSLFYGNLYANNRHCLLKIFDFVEMAEDSNVEGKSLKDELIPYLEKLSNDEVKKVLASIGQSLTYCAEYNFIDELRLTPNLISEVYFVDSGVNLSLADLKGEDYQNALNEISEGRIPENVPSNQLKFHISTDYSNFYYGNAMPRIYNDISDVDPKNFSSGYFETRSLVPSFVDMVSPDKLEEFSSKKEALQKKEKEMQVKATALDQMYRDKTLRATMLIDAYKAKLDKRSSEYKYPGLGFLKAMGVDVGFTKSQKEEGIETLKALAERKITLSQLFPKQREIIEDGEMSQVLDGIRNIFKA